MSSFHVVIPARYASSRLPGKALRELAGRTMLEHVWRAASASAAGEVIVATDDVRIREAAQAFGARALLTDATHASGSDRMDEVATNEGWRHDDVVVNVQCDEPMLPPALIDQVAGALSAGGDIATLAAPPGPDDDIDDPNTVKVVTDSRGRALYFSRAPIPFHRDAPGSVAGTLRHLGLYAYRVGALQRLCALPVCELERIERLEQLRALHAGMRIDVAIAAADPGPGVDTEADLAKAAALMQAAR